MNSIGLPRDVSEHGHLIDSHITGFSLYIIIGAMVVITGWLFYVAFVHGKNHEAKYDHGHKRPLLYFAFIGLVAFEDFSLWWAAMRDVKNTFWNFAKAEAHPEAVKIEINAHQWAWDARYPGADGEFNTADDIVTLNDIRVPVGVPVVIQLASVDVIHSFYLPNFRVKQDAVPGMITRLWFQAKETGTFDIGCAQHCGVNHYKMKGQLTVLPKDEYARWAERASQLAAAAYDKDDPHANWGWAWKTDKDVKKP